MQDLCQQLMTPVSQSMTSSIEWVQAVDAIENARDLAQVTRCGKASLVQVSERLQQWKANGGHKDPSKERLLTDCCHTFIEHCAEIVEMEGVPPKLASNLLGASVRMAEVVGKTGLLLFAMESEFNELADKVSKVERVYDVVVKRVELVAGEIARLEKQADSATARLEMALKRESEMKSQCQQLKRSLQAARGAKRFEKSPGRAWGRSPDARSLTPEQTPGTWRSQRQDSPESRSLQAKSIGRGPNDLDQEPWQRERIGYSPTSTNSPSATVRSSTRMTPSNVAQDPLEGAVQAAFDHLKTLLDQVEHMHGLSHPLGLSSTSPFFSKDRDLELASMTTIHSWADTSLKLRDPILAASVKQSASHLQCLARLWKGQANHMP